MKVDTMFQRKEDEETDEEGSSKTSDSLFFMEADHEEFRETEDQNTEILGSRNHRGMSEHAKNGRDGSLAEAVLSLLPQRAYKG